MGNRNIKLASFFLAILLVSTSNVIAFGISSPYWKNHPLKMYPGETKEVLFNLQNCPSLSEQCQRKDVNVLVNFDADNEIAQLLSGTTYQIPFGTADTYIKLKVSIPEDAEIGNTYNIKFSVSSAPEKIVTNIQLGIEYGVEFPVLVTEKSAIPETNEDFVRETEVKVINKQEKKNANVSIILGILILMAGIIIYLILKRNRFKH